MKNRQIQIIAARSGSQRQIFLWSLVLNAGRIPHQVELRKPEWLILVMPEHEAATVAEIAAYEAENRNWPPPLHTAGASHVFLAKRPVVIPVIGLLVAAYAITGPWRDNARWFAAGAVATNAMKEGAEWWRVFTALMLHADSVHLLGNVAIGGLLAYYLCRLTGSGVGWLLVLLAGGLGNTVNVLLRGGDFESVGFSTAVFAMVGLLTGLRFVRLTSMQEVLIGAGGALSLLAFLGSEGQRTDLGAHLWGLLAGLLLGVVAARSGLLRAAVLRPVQVVTGLLAACIMAGAWWLALAG